MKYFVISDIHGSSYFFKKAMRLFDEQHCDALIILGDLLYHGPRNDLPYGHNVKELVELLNERKDHIICVRGNCDAEVDQMVLDFVIEENKFIKINNRDVYLTHGHKKDIDNIFKKGTLVLSGHTHIHKFEMRNDIYYFNPGSVSLPKNNQQHSFAIIENDDIYLYNIDGSIIEKYNLKGN